MDQFAPQPDLTLQLPRDMYYQVIHTLRGAMPPPVTRSPEDLVRRDNAVIAQVACLLPANADEANIAALYVAASAQALDCLRLAREFPAGEALILKCSAQAASMMRESRAARSLLMRVQALRQKREADHTALDQAAWIEHCAINLMADALGRTALGRTPPAPIAEPPPAMSTPAMSTPAMSTPAEATPVEEPAPQPDPAAEAEQYAIIYPRRAALIRSLGGLPDRPDFGPPAPALVHAIVTGTSPTLRALDRPGAAPITA
jgi:hypothetical protein